MPHARADTVISPSAAGPSSLPPTPDLSDFIPFPDSDEEAGSAGAVEDEEQSEDEESSEEDSEDSKDGGEDEDDDDDGTESDDSITSERLNALLDKARAKARQQAAEKGDLGGDVIKLSDDRPLPKLDASSLLPQPYFTLPTSSQPPKLALDPGTERLTVLAQKRKAEPEPERVTKKQRREQREKTAGPEWFDMPSPSGVELAKIKREMEAARLAAALDPKKFLRKEAMKQDIPKYVQLGKIIETKSPFERQSNKNLTRAEKKKSIVDELVEDAEARSYAKRKFLDLQGVRGARGKLTMRRRQEMKAARRKW